MSAEIVNLRRFKKLKARQNRAAVASITRARTGLSKAERDAQKDEQLRLARSLDGAERTSLRSGVDLPPAANSPGFPDIALHEDEDLDPGNVS